jgi:hypothetical protein
MSMRWGRRAQQQPVRDSVVEFREGALPAAVHEINANDIHVMNRLDDMSRRVEEVQRRNRDLESKLASQNESIRDQAHEKYTALLERRIAMQDDAARNDLARNDPARNDPARNDPARDDVARNEVARKATEPRVGAYSNTPKAAALEAVDRLSRIHMPLCTAVASPLADNHAVIIAPVTPPLSTGVEADAWLAERSRLHQLRSARDRIKA